MTKGASTLPRSGDMIMSDSIAERAAFWRHPDLPDAQEAARGQFVVAQGGPGAGVAPDKAAVVRLQEHVQAVRAPYPYLRLVVFAGALRKTATAKIQRSRLRQPCDGRKDMSFARTSSGQGIEVCVSSQLAAST